MKAAIGRSALGILVLSLALLGAMPILISGAEDGTDVPDPVPPGPVEVDEGETIHLLLSSHDPEWYRDDCIESEWDLGNGDWATGWPGFLYGYGQDGVYDVSAYVDGILQGDEWSITVYNVPPEVEAGDDQVAYAGVAFSLDARVPQPPEPPLPPVPPDGAALPAALSDAPAESSGSLFFTDAGWLDAHSATVSWGDGTVEPGEVIELNPLTPKVPACGTCPPEGYPRFRPLAQGTVVGSHTYASGGVYVVEVCVDDDADQVCDTFRVAVQPVPAIVNCVPEKLNLGHGGGLVTCFIELPGGLDVFAIDPDTVQYQGVPAVRGMVSQGNSARYVAQFSRQDLAELGLAGGAVELQITGQVGYEGELVDFEGTDTVFVIP